MTTTRPEVTFREPQDNSFSQSVTQRDGVIQYDALSCNGCVTSSPSETWSLLAVGTVVMTLGAIVLIVIVRKTLCK